MKNMKRFYALLSLILVVILTIALTGCAGNTEKNNDSTSLSGTVWAVASVNVNGDTYTPDEMIEHGMDVPGMARFFEFTDDTSSHLLVVLDGKVFGVQDFSYNYDGENLTFETDKIVNATLTDDGLFILFDGGNEFQLVKIDEDIVEPTVGTVVTFASKPAEEPAEEPTQDDNAPDSSNGKYTYRIDGHDWVIGIKIEDLIHDGQIDASELHIALGFDRTGDLRDANNTVIAKSVAFTAGAKHGPYDTIVVFGNANHRDYRIFYYFMGDSSENAITIAAGPRSFRVTLNQLVVAIYGCEQYRDGEIHEDVYGNLLDDYVWSEGYYLIP